MIKRLINIFDLSQEQGTEIDSMEIESRGQSMLLKANQDYAKADMLITKAESELWQSVVQNQDRYGEYRLAKKKRPTSRKAAAALEYATNLKLAAKNWESAERLVLQWRERLAFGRKAKQAAKAEQKAADKVIKRANAMIAKKVS